MFELAEANEQASIALENALHLLLILRETLFGEAQEQPETPEELNGTARWWTAQSPSCPAR